MKSNTEQLAEGLTNATRGIATGFGDESSSNLNKVAKTYVENRQRTLLNPKNWDSDPTVLTSIYSGLANLLGLTR